MNAVVHLLCGLNGAGKSRYAKTLPVVRFSLDQLMLRRHGLRFDDPAYPALAAAAREQLWGEALAQLNRGHAVVLDWNLWSRRLRREWSQRALTAGFAVQVHYIRVSVEVAVQRALARVDGGSFALTENEVRHLAGLFEEPDAREGLPLLVID